jgi:hypothetical protein
MIDAVIFNAFLEFIDASLMFANPQSQARILDAPAASSRRAGPYVCSTPKYFDALVLVP